MFKDQLIVFGGLKQTRDILEDMMVLHLKDSENHLQALKKEDMKNICKYCQMIYGMQSVRGDDDETLYTKVSVEHKQPQHKVTVSFVQSLVKMITWPFTCFALLVDNAYIANARSLRITLLQKPRLIVFANQSEGEFPLPSIPVLEVQEESSPDAVRFTYNGTSQYLTII